LRMTRKLIEVSLPLDVINDASAYDKMPGIGAHPKGIHHWWARLPLPSARAVLFASLVDDPSSHPETFLTEEAQQKERQRLFDIINRLCQKKMHLHQDAFIEANKEILSHCKGHVPTVFDPFAGGGSIPLEAMRLGLPVIASDLNPVAVMINKATLELLPSIATHSPINPESKIKPNVAYKNGKGISEDLKYYGREINEIVRKKIGMFYPKVKYKDSVNGKEKEANVITWLWARTVKCPNPACGCEMPLVRSFILSTKRDPAPYIKPVIVEHTPNSRTVKYEVNYGDPEIKGTVNRSGATCVACNGPVKLDYIREEGRAGRIKYELIGIVADGGKNKFFLSPTEEQQKIAATAKPIWKPETKLPEKALGFRVQLYGYDEHWKLFTNRQLLGLNEFQQEIGKLCSKLSTEASPNYIKSIEVLFNFCIDRLADFNNAFTRWKSSGEQQMQLFNRQVVPMVWDFPEANILEPRAISWLNAVDIAADATAIILSEISTPQNALQFNAANHEFKSPTLLISTDPPYYDNIGYSDLSDFFYVWMRKGLQDKFPDLLKTVLVPKMEELVASDSRYGSKQAAKDHFEEGFRSAFGNFKKGMDPRFPLTVYYAFKQEEEGEEEDDDSITLTTGWETLLEGLVSSGFQITATWPIKASQQWRMRAMGSNALTSYIVMVCRIREEDSATISRRDYIQELRRELPTALRILQKSNLAPVDLAQAALGPGMGIFSKYKSVLEQDGSNMKVRTALSMINQSLDEILTEQEGDFDPETRWAISWFEQNSYSQGVFGDADALARARNTAVNALAQSGIVLSGSGQVRIITRAELPADWGPLSDDKIVIWKMTQHLIKQLQEKGELGAAMLYKRLGIRADVSRELAYRLFTICEKKGWSQEAQAYNSLVLSWNLIVSESFNIRDKKPEQGTLFE
jgi:putative DNA methylase